MPSAGSRALATQSSVSSRAVQPWTQGRGYALLAAVPCVYLAVFFVWPLARVALRSVMEPRPGIGNYTKILSGGPFLQILFYTLEVAAIVTAVALLIAYPIAALTARMQGLRLQLMTALIVGSLWTSAVIRSYAWMIVFQRYGIVNEALIWLGLADAPVRILQTTTAVVIGMVHVLLPFMLLPLIATMRRIDPNLLRAGRILGKADPFRLFLRVYFPLSLPGVHAGTVLVFISSLGFFITPSLLGGGRTTMAAMIIEQEANVFLDWPMASAIATVLLAFTLVLYLVYARAPCTRGCHPRGYAMSAAVTRGLNRGGSALLLTLLVVFLVAPLIVVVLMSFTNQIYLTFPPTGLVLRWYIAAWNESRWIS